MMKFDITNIQFWSLSSDGFFRLMKGCDISVTVGCGALHEKVNQDHALTFPKDLFARIVLQSVIDLFRSVSTAGNRVVGSWYSCVSWQGSSLVQLLRVTIRPLLQYPPFDVFFECWCKTSISRSQRQLSTTNPCNAKHKESRNIHDLLSCQIQLGIGCWHLPNSLSLRARASSVNCWPQMLLADKFRGKVWDENAFQVFTTTFEASKPDVNDVLGNTASLEHGFDIIENTFALSASL